MRLLFAGTPAFAGHALRAILSAGHNVVLVLTQPDRPSGRGLDLKPSAIKQIALEYDLPVAQPTTLRSEPVLATLRDVDADVIVVAAYGLILPQAVLDVTRFGCINIHASLLPRWRGAAPIQRSMLAGDAETGVSIMQMDAGLDTGPIFFSRSLSIAVGETSGTLNDKLAILGAECIVEALARLAAGRLHATPQPAVGVTYASKISKEEARVVWARPAVEIERAVRAYDPAPCAYTTYRGEILKIWKASLATDPDVECVPGRILERSPINLVVTCGDGALKISEIQRAGGRRQPVEEFLRGSPLVAGDLLGT